MFTQKFGNILFQLWCFWHYPWGFLHHFSSRFISLCATSWLQRQRLRFFNCRIRLRPKLVFHRQPLFYGRSFPDFKAFLNRSENLLFFVRHVLISRLAWRWKFHTYCRKHFWHASAVLTTKSDLPLQYKTAYIWASRQKLFFIAIFLI